MTPGPREEIAYQSKYWPALNGTADDASGFAGLAGFAAEVPSASERENALRDVIGAYDLLRLQGLSGEQARRRLGLRKSRDELVQELDVETWDRLLRQSNPQG